MIIERQRKAGARKEALAATKERERRQTGRGECISEQKSLNNAAILQMEQKAKKAKAGSMNSRQRSNGASSKASSIHCSNHRSEH